MAPVAPELIDRRGGRRVTGGGSRFGVAAVVRPGQAVVLVNISSRGALVESGRRLRPGVRTELHLCGSGTGMRVHGRVERCRVVRLDPVRYHGVIVFDDLIEIDGRAQGSG